MQPSQYNDDYWTFPYPPQTYDDGNNNNGGIDLTLEPHRLSEIKEAENFPELRRFIEDLIPSAFITLGCDAGQPDEFFEGYVEFSLRDEKAASNLEFVSNLDEQFNSWVESQNQESAQIVRSLLRWEYKWFSYHGTSERLKIAIFFCARDQVYAGQLLLTVLRYLLDVCKVPS